MSKSDIEVAGALRARHGHMPCCRKKVCRLKATSQAHPRRRGFVSKGADCLSLRRGLDDMRVLALSPRSEERAPPDLASEGHQAGRIRGNVRSKDVRLACLALSDPAKARKGPAARGRPLAAGQMKQETTSGISNFSPAWSCRVKSYKALCFIWLGAPMGRRPSRGGCQAANGSPIKKGWN